MMASSSSHRLLFLSQQKKRWLTPHYRNSHKNKTIPLFSTSSNSTAISRQNNNKNHNHNWSLQNIIHLLTTQKLTCEELIRYCYTTAIAGEEIYKLHAFSRIMNWKELQQQAEESDKRRIQQREIKSILDGIPISVKANIAVEDQILTAGSRMLGEKETTAAAGTTCTAVGYNAELVQTLVNDCGAIIIGITNMDEFGMGSLGTNVPLISDAECYDIDNDSTCTQQQQQQQQQQRYPATKNPLPFLHNNHNNGGNENDSSSLSLLEILQQSPEEIINSHQKVIELDTKSHNIIPHYSAGGSSCGAACSVAHGSSLIALGSDTGGSIRLPAAWCRVAGLKPSYGRTSRHGLVSYASSLDTIGFLTPTTSCASTVLKEIRSKEQQQQQENPLRRSPPQDSTSHYYSNSSASMNVNGVNGTSTNTSDNNNKILDENNYQKTLEGISIGIPASFSVQECPPSLKELWIQGAITLEKAGATIKTLSNDVISPKVIQQSLAAYYVLASAEASSNLARYDGFRYGIDMSSASVNGEDKKASSDVSDKNDTSNQQHTTTVTELQRQYSATRTHGFGPEVIRRILCGTAVLSSDKFHTHYEAAAKIRALVTQQLHDALDTQVDYLLIPTALSSPPRLDNYNNSSGGGGSTAVDATEMFGNDVMTVPISLAGLAAVNVPLNNTGSSSSGTIESIRGLQLVGRRLEEERLLSVAQCLEENFIYDKV